MYNEALKETLIKNPRFSKVYFNENDDTQYIFHPNANFRKVVSRDEILNAKKVVAEATENTENETKTSKKNKNK